MVNHKLLAFRVLKAKSVNLSNFFKARKSVQGIRVKNRKIKQRTGRFLACTELGIQNSEILGIQQAEQTPKLQKCCKTHEQHFLWRSKKRIFLKGNLL
jgi:hypothetical protein